MAIRLALLPKDEADDRAAILEIRPAAGGDEAGLFAAELFGAYQKYAALQGWRWELLEYNESELGGLKEGIAEITGKSVFARLKFESGVHRVQRVPATETQGRIHTSTVTVAVLPEAEEVDVDINEGDLRIDVYRASGAGGQHVNKTESAVRITHIPTGIVVAMQEERSQHKNKAKAMKILRSRMYDQQRASVDATRAADRKGQVGTGDRSERIRTYNFPQGRVTRPPHQPDPAQDRPGDAGRIRRYHRGADRRGPGGAAGGGKLISTPTALAEITARLKAAGIEEPRREARLILAAALGTNAAGLMALDGWTRGPTSRWWRAAPRTSRWPISPAARSSGGWILPSPRQRSSPGRIRKPSSKPYSSSGLQPRNVLDLGTGTGCLLLAVLHEMPQPLLGSGWISTPEAAALARRNAQALGLAGRAAFLAGSWADPLEPEIRPGALQPALYRTGRSVPPDARRAAIRAGAGAGWRAPTALPPTAPLSMLCPAFWRQMGWPCLNWAPDRPYQWQHWLQRAGFSSAFRRDLAGIERALLLRFCK